MVAEAVAAANETVIAMTHKLVNEAKQAATQEARTILAEILHADKSANGADIDMKMIQILIEKSKSEAIMEAARLATTVNEEAVKKAARLANSAKYEAKILLNEAQVTSIDKATILAKTAKVDAIKPLYIL